MSEILEHNCGLVVAHTLPDAYQMIHSLQHRGREAAGIAAIGERRIDVLKWRGNVSQFDIEDLHKIFPGSEYHTFLAHVRYASRGRKEEILEDAHPHTIGGSWEDHGSHLYIRNCDAAMVHNGQIRKEDLAGAKLDKVRGECDTEALLHYYMQNREHELVRQIPGAYLVAIADKRRREVIVARDRTGIKPGILGSKGGKYGVASEDIAFRKNRGQYVDTLDPGALYYFDRDGNYRIEKVAEQRLGYCFFEYNYLADVDSMMNGVNVRRVREILGEMAAQELEMGVDLVSYLPRCPEVAARSFAKKKRLPFESIFYKMRGERSFQGSTTHDRKVSIDTNLHLLPGKRMELQGKTVALLEDSTVRGNTLRRAHKLLYEEAGVHQAIIVNYTPPIGIIGEDGVARGCEFGVDMPPNDDFIARGRTVAQISQEVEMDVRYISLEGMLKAFEKAGLIKEELCTFCIGGKKPF
jgi:amidophosphoribosyltransferase